MVRRLKRSDRGAISPMVAIMAPAFLLLVGLVFDGGMALDAKQRGYDVAEQAARYGAAHGISEQALRNNQLTIDPGLASTAASQFVNDTNDSRVSFDSARVDLNGVGDQIVTVTVRVKAHSAFLCGCDLGLGTVQAHAQVLRGVIAPGG